MSLAATIRAMVRREILRLLAADAGYSQNHAIIRRAMESSTAQSLTETEVREHLSWMEDRGLVTTETVGPYLLAKLTDRGLSVARGEEHVEGVERPRPSELG
jgi:repressor of nif and glnA expression